MHIDVLKIKESEDLTDEYFLYFTDSNSRIFTAPYSPEVTGIDGSVWRNTVTIVGISLCAVITCVVIAVAFYHRCLRKGEHKYKMATAQIDSPSHVPKSTSMQSTPSHHSALSNGIEIDYDMERPLTGQSQKKTSRGSSISSNRSNGKTSNSKLTKSNKGRFKTKADIEPGGSPKPQSKHYSPLPSPHIKSRKDEHVDEKSGLFNTSPLAGRRSPKVHPSTRFPRTPIVKTPTSPLDIKSDSLARRKLTPSSPKETKYDILSRRRQSASKAREITPIDGADKPLIPNSSQVISPLSAGTITPTPTMFSPGGRSVQSESERTKLLGLADSENDRQRTPTAKYNNFEQLNLMDKSDHDEMRKSGSGASDDSPDKVHNGDLETTSFITKPSDGSTENPKPRRPTSLTESYSNLRLKLSALELADSGDSQSNDNLANFDRHNDLPKPDGQSPKPTRENSKSSTPRSIRSSKSKNTLSPSRSIATPSDNGLEMEYDDFIDMDDTYSYFDPVETEKLNWKGAEKIGKVDEKEEQEASTEKHIKPNS